MVKVTDNYDEIQRFWDIWTRRVGPPTIVDAITLNNVQVYGGDAYISDDGERIEFRILNGPEEVLFNNPKAMLKASLEWRKLAGKYTLVYRP